MKVERLVEISNYLIKGQACQELRRRQWHPTPVLLPGKSHGRRSLAGCNPWGHWGLDTTERLDFHFSLSCIGEGNGNPLQCSCLENPRDGGAWWAAVYGVAQSQTRLKWLSSMPGTYAATLWGLIDAFELVCWRRLLRVPWTKKRSNLSILKEISLFFFSFSYSFIEI